MTEGCDGTNNYQIGNKNYIGEWETHVTWCLHGALFIKSVVINYSCIKLKPLFITNN